MDDPRHYNEDRPMTPGRALAKALELYYLETTEDGMEVIPSACRVMAEHVSAALHASGYTIARVEDRVEDMEGLRRVAESDGYFLFNLGYPWDVEARDSEGDVVIPAEATLDALIEVWASHEVKELTPEAWEEYREDFACQLGNPVGLWDAARPPALEGQGE